MKRIRTITAWSCPTIN